MASASERGVDRLLAGDVTAADADDDVKTAFLGRDKEFFSLQQYSFNLTPALREEISKDLSAMLTEREPHLKDQEHDPRPSLRPSSIERKASFVLKAARTASGPPPPPPPEA